MQLLENAWKFIRDLLTKMPLPDDWRPLIEFVERRSCINQSVWDSFVGMLYGDDEDYNHELWPFLKEFVSKCNNLYISA